MGRGRAKAKQAKVARQLKYSTGGTDLEALRAEIVGESSDDSGREDEDVDDTGLDAYDTDDEDDDTRR
jgi:hypothetical protein